MTRWHEQDDSQFVFNSIICFIKQNVYTFLYPGPCLSFVTSYVAINLKVIPDNHSEPFNVSKHVGETIRSKRVQCDCAIFFNHNSSMTNLVELNIVDFDIILVID